jgi:hypothetical protein
MTRARLRTVVDAADLERRVKDMYTRVALDPQGPFHFEMGRAMARRLGYTDAELDAAPSPSNRSLASATTSIWRICTAARRSLISAAARGWIASLPPTRSDRADR